MNIEVLVVLLRYQWYNFKTGRKFGTFLLCQLFSAIRMWINVNGEFEEIKEKGYRGEVQVMYQNVSVSQWRATFWARGPNQEKIRRLFMYKRNNEARSCNHCCRGGAESITYSECKFVALDIQHATSIRHIVWGLSGSTSFSHIISQTALFSQYTVEYKTCVLIFSINFVWKNSHSKGNWAKYNQKCILVFM